MRFDNLDELMHPAYMENPLFSDLLRQAIGRGTPVTLAEAAERMGEVPLDW